MKKIILFFLLCSIAFVGTFPLDGKVAARMNSDHPSIIIQQDNKRVTGIITNTQGEPIAGVGIYVKGSDIGTISDEKGAFSIVVPTTASLSFSSLGYTEQTISIENRNIINVTLKYDALFIDESVVVGYGTMKKRDLTGAISQIKGDDINFYPLGSASDALQGRVAGVTITSTSGSPGHEGTVRIRGIGTINNNNPLYVIDGLPQSNASWLNPNDIATVEVLKDASAQAIYGARAANGVILITTKRSDTSEDFKSSVDFDMSIGIQNPIKMYDMLDAGGFIRYKNTAYQNAGTPLLDDFSTQEKINEILDFLEKNGGRRGTDWQNLIRDKNALVQNYNLSLSGGAKRLHYRASFGYVGQDGTIKESKFQRITGRLNLDSQVFSWLNFSANVNIIHSRTISVTENSPYSGTEFSALTADPITPPCRDHLVDIPSFLESKLMYGYEPTNPFSKFTGLLYSNKPNPLAQINRFKQGKAPRLSIKSDIIGEIIILPYLKFRSSLGLDLGRSDTFNFTPKYYLNATDQSTVSRVSNSASKSDYWIWDNYFTFDKTFNSTHKVTVVVGMSAEETKSESFSASKEGLTNNDESQRILSAATQNATTSGTKSSSALNSYFGRLFYSYANKYMITANLRYDGSSMFASGNRWGFFPSVSGGWVFSDENFIKNAIGTWLSEGKLRGGWGEIGNQNISAGAYLTTYANSSYYRYGNPFSNWLSGNRNRVGNPDIKWETTRQADIGIDLAFFNDALRFSFDWYKKKTSGMLLQVPMPATLGFPNTPWSNAGSVQNKGFEITIEYRGQIGKDYVYNIGGNISHYKNKVISLGGGTPIANKTHLGVQTHTRTEEKKPIGYYYGYKWDGVFQTEEEIENYRGGQDNAIIMPAAQPGDLKFLDLNDDGKITDADRTMIGNPHPDFTFGLNLGGKYKSFDFSMLLQGSVGNDVLNMLKYDIYSGQGWYNAPKDIFDKYWTGPGSTNKNFAISANVRDNLQQSEWFVEDGTYIRLKTLTVGYTLPPRFTQKMSIKNLRVYLSTQNLFTITGYSGLDPEMGNSNPQLMGIDMGWYPSARVFLFGLSLNL